MASGDEYRTRRPNTWLLRPTPQVKILLANPEPSTHGHRFRWRGAAVCRLTGVDRKVCIQPQIDANDPKRTPAHRVTPKEVGAPVESLV
jgi:hypothetical protein